MADCCGTFLSCFFYVILWKGNVERLNLNRPHYHYLALKEQGAGGGSKKEKKEGGKKERGPLLLFLTLRGPPPPPPAF